MIKNGEHELKPIAQSQQCEKCKHNKEVTVVMPFLPMPEYECGYSECNGKLCLRWVGKRKKQ